MSHQDISPDNLILGLDNRLHLIDFGAATMKQIDYNHQQTTIILKKGYAPPEQYLSSGNMGTWSDIYALCATIYFAVSGQTPVSAIDRLQKDTLRPLSDFSDISPRAASIIERGLSLHTADSGRHTTTPRADSRKLPGTFFRNLIPASAKGYSDPADIMPCSRRHSVPDRYKITAPSESCFSGSCHLIRYISGLRRNITLRSKKDV